MKKFLSLGIIIVLVFALAACGDSSSGKADVEFICGTTFTETDIGGVTMKEFEEYVETESDGRIDVQIHYNSALGGEREMLEGLQMGTINMCFPAASLLTTYDKKFAIYDLPFLFSTEEEANKAFTGELSETYGKWLEEQGLYQFGWGVMGFAGMSNNKREIKTPKDLNGLKMRVMEAEEYVTMFKLLGANPITMSYDEVYTGLQQGTIDGQDNPPIYTVEPGFYEEQDFYTITNHRIECAPFVSSIEFMNSLDEDLKKIIDDGMSDVVANYCERAVEANTDYLKQMEDSGIKITELTDSERAKFEEKVQPMYDEFREHIGDDMMNLALSYSGRSVD